MPDPASSRKGVTDGILWGTIGDHQRIHGFVHGRRVIAWQDNVQIAAATPLLYETSRVYLGAKKNRPRVLNFADPATSSVVLGLAVPIPMPTLPVTVSVEDKAAAPVTASVLLAFTAHGGS